MIKQAAINASANGDNQLVAGVAGLRIRVVNFVLYPAAGVTAKLTDGPAGANLTGPMVRGTSGLYPGWAGLDMDGWSGHFETSQGNDLTLNLNAGTQVGGYVNYVLVK